MFNKTSFSNDLYFTTTVGVQLFEEKGDITRKTKHWKLNIRTKLNC